MLIIPQTSQRQIPGTSQSVARILLELAPNASVSRNFTHEGEPEWITPDAGFIAWRYLDLGVRRYGRPLPINLTEQFIFTDYPQLEIDQVLVMLRFGVTATIFVRTVPI